MLYSERVLSDRQVREIAYIDCRLLPLQESMRSIDGYQKWTQIWTHISGKRVIWRRGLAKRVRRVKSQ